MNKEEKLEVLKYINTTKRKFFNKYFKYKNVDTIAKNIIRTFLLKFNTINTLFYFALYGFTRLINDNNYTLELKKGQLSRLYDYHKSFVKINMHADMINKEFEKITNKFKNL